MSHLRVRGIPGTFALAAACVVAMCSLAEAQGGTGLRGEYYDNIDLNGAPAGGRLDATVNFADFTSAELEAMGLTPAGTADETFSVRWQGTLLTTTAGLYTFRTRSDDRMRLWVNGILVCDNWKDQAPTDSQPGQLDLGAAARYSIRAEFAENGGGDVAIIRWTPPAGADVFIPTSQLFPDVAPPTITPAGGNFTTSVMVSLSTSYIGATIRFTTDGSDVTAGSTAYTAPFAVTANTTVKAMAFINNMNSAVGVSQSIATFTVADSTPPKIAQIRTPQGADRIFVIFDEPVAAGATTVGNYSLTLAAGGAGPAVSAAAAQDVRTVVLTTGALTNGTNYVLSVINVQDGGGRAIDTGGVPYQRVFTARTTDTTLADYWKMDDAGAGMTNTANGANGGTLTNGPLNVPGRWLGAAELDGINDYVALAQNMTAKLGGADCTVTAWIKTQMKPDVNNKINVPCLFGLEMNGTDDYFYGYVLGNNRINVARGDGGISSSTGALGDVWHHVAFTSALTSGNVQCFVDGVPQGAVVVSETGAKGQAFTVNRLGMLMNATGGGINFTSWLGDIDEVRVYTSVLTTAQIQEHVNQPPSVSATGPASVGFGATASLTATATDDGLPTGGALTYAWTAPTVPGGGNVNFSAPTATTTNATFTGAAGTYVIRVTVSDGSCVSSADLVIDVDRISISPTGNPTRLVTSEPNVNNTFNITFNTPAANTVDVTVTSSDGTEALVSGQGQGPATTITFTMNAGFVGQIPITLHGQDDDIDDGNINYTVTITTASADGNFNALTLPQVLCTNNDDDTPGVTVTSAGGLVTSENPTAPQNPASFFIRLDSQPQGASVTISLASSNTAEGTVSPATLTFTTTRDQAYDPVTGVGGWNVDHQVFITGADDAILDFSQTYFITTGVATGADYTVLNINPIDPQVTNLDDEQIPTLKEVWGCGLTGVEIFLPLGLLSLWRRRRKNS